jgi:nucleoside-diphosphate-sugar epimerase
MTIAYQPLPRRAGTLPVDDPAKRRPDIAVASSTLGWEPKVELGEGLERTAAFFRDQL